MSAIARVLHERGVTVTGSDLARSRYAEALERAGVKVTYGHQPEAVRGADLVLSSAAVPQDDVELVEARSLGIPILHRDDFWGELTKGYEILAVAGTHGKTTTSGLITWLLERAGAAPTFIVGADLVDFKANARAGGGPHFVVEADEYGLAFLGLFPNVGIVTNVEHDHPDEFATEEDVQKAFQSFADQIQDLLIYCADNPGASALEVPGRGSVSYGLSAEADWRAAEIRPNQAGGSDFLVIHKGEVLGLARIRLPGIHNVLNTLAALAAVDHVGVRFSDARESLTEFHGAARRLEVIGESGGVTVVDDYAHHPTEIEASLSALRARFPDARLWAVFQPHTFSRTKAFLDRWGAAFGAADEVLVTPIFASREANDPSVNAAMVAERVEGKTARTPSTLEAAAEFLLDEVAPGDVVVTLSAGDGNRVGELLLEGLSRKGES
jgi:UDP-N-acetylmuramate--alanine ligase